ncbi:hypothetical protein [Streptomyces sp. AS02]|uniref:hypothetical protein n=1 Tax=Streptomyces sp. AS02 TaxID=2938946 RepID=UPI0034D42D8B
MGEPCLAVAQDIRRIDLLVGQAAGDMHVAFQRQRLCGTAGRLGAVHEGGGPFGQNGVRESGEVTGGLGVHGTDRRDRVVGVRGAVRRLRNSGRRQ